MCGIVGAVTHRDITHFLIEGLEKLEYRGYDSAGIAVIHHNELMRLRCLGKVIALKEKVEQEKIIGNIGIAHTRWATHGEPSEKNAHPHVSDKDKIAVVHNGIIENHHELRRFLENENVIFKTETDTEVIGHLIYYFYQQENNLLKAIQSARKKLIGAFALGIISEFEPDTLYAVRSGSPLVIGLGHKENFITSDPLAIASSTDQCIYLEEGDLARLTANTYTLFDKADKKVARQIYKVNSDQNKASKDQYPHFMLKEIYEQPHAIIECINGHLRFGKIQLDTFDPALIETLKKIKRISLIACGTSYHAGFTAKYWLESFAKIPTHVEVASESRYRDTCIEENALFIALSQSGETADTLAALRQAKETGYQNTLAITNVAGSSLARESDFVLLTRAGREIGVAATKTFTAQLVALLLLTCLLTKLKGLDCSSIESALNSLPGFIQQFLNLDAQIAGLAKYYSNKQHALFLGRNVMYPIAMEGALKLKEISYVHAEAYPAGELKHGPLALVDEDMPITVVMPRDHLTQKLISNVQEVQARKGQLFIFADESIKDGINKNACVISVPSAPNILAPILYTIPLQLLSYYVAVAKGTDVDQPRNLAKSVTVE